MICWARNTRRTNLPSLSRWCFISYRSRLAKISCSCCIRCRTYRVSIKSAENDNIYSLCQKLRRFGWKVELSFISIILWSAQPQYLSYRSKSLVTEWQVKLLISKFIRTLPLKFHIPNKLYRWAYYMSVPSLSMKWALPHACSFKKKA